MVDVIQFLMVWLACVFPFGVYATMVVYTGRMPRKLPAVLVAVLSFASPAWIGWPMYVLAAQGAGLLAIGVVGYAAVIGLLLGLATLHIKSGLLSFGGTAALFGVGLGVQQLRTSWGWTPMIVSVGLWHFAMGAILISWLWSLHDKDETDRGQLCDTCGYDMAGLDHGICPECGHQHESRAEHEPQPV